MSTKHKSEWESRLRKVLSKLKHRTDGMTYEEAITEITKLAKVYVCPPEASGVSSVASPPVGSRTVKDVPRRLVRAGGSYLDERF